MMLPHLQNIVDEAQVARTLANNFKLLNQVPVRIGIMSTVGPVRLSRFLAKFQLEYEGVEVAVTEASVSDLSGEPYIDRLACEMREMVARVYDDRKVELYARLIERLQTAP